MWLTLQHGVASFPDLHHLQCLVTSGIYANTEGEGLGDFVMCVDVMYRGNIGLTESRHTEVVLTKNLEAFPCNVCPKTGGWSVYEVSLLFSTLEMGQCKHLVGTSPFGSTVRLPDIHVMWSLRSFILKVKKYWRWFRPWNEFICCAFSLYLHYSLYLSLKYCPSWLSLCPGQGGHGAQREVTLTLKHGVEAKNYDDVSISY